VGNTNNSEFWSHKFYYSSTFTNSYCSSSAGQSDHGCLNGRPVKNPPYDCYGYTDFIQYMHDCAIPFMPYGDRGAQKMNVYYWLIKNCDNTYCPDGKMFLMEWCKPDAQGKYDTKRCLGPNKPKLPNSGTPYIPDAISGTQ